MTSTEVQEHLYQYLVKLNTFNSPYGVLCGNRVNKKGIPFKSITFGRSRTLDATISIYNSKFIVLYDSRNRMRQVYRSVEELKTELDSM